MFDHILIPFDDISDGLWALSHALTIAKSVHGQITLANLLKQMVTSASSQFVDPLTWQISKTEAEAQLDNAAYYVQRAGIQVNKVVLESDTTPQLIAFAQNQGINLIVLAHSRDTVDRVHEWILHSSIPILVVRAEKIAPADVSSTTYKKLLVPLDGSQRAEHILPLATALAEACHAQLLLAHVVRRPEIPRRATLTQDDIELAERLVERNREEAASYLEQLEARLSATVEVRSHLLIDSGVARALYQLIEQEAVDMTILSAHGYSGEPEWPYGSITSRFLAYSSKPVLIAQDLPASPSPTMERVVPRESRGQ